MYIYIGNKNLFDGLFYVLGLEPMNFVYSENKFYSFLFSKTNILPNSGNFLFLQLLILVHC
jgi:hypothetical protein